MIPDEAVEAALSALFPDKPTVDGFARNVWIPTIETVLEAALPALLSHEREETRLAHLDAVVNAQTVDRLERELNDERQKVELLLSTQSRPAALFALAEAWDRGIEAGVDGFVPECDYARNPYRAPLAE